MAVDLGSAVGYINLDISGLQKNLSSMQSQIDGAMKQTEQSVNSWQKSVEKSFNNVGQKLKSFALSWQGAFVATLSTAVTKGIKSAMSFDEALTHIQVNAGLTADEIARLSDVAQKMGSGGNKSAQDYANAFQLMSQAGWDAEQMLQAINAIDDASLVSQKNLNQVTQEYIDIMASFGLSASDAEKTLSSLASVAQDSKVSFSDLMSGMSRLGALSKAMGFSVDDVASAIAKMSNAGFDGASKLDTLFRQMNSNASAFESAGIQLTDAEGKYRSLSDILTQVKEKMEGLTEAEATQLATSLGGMMGAQAFVALLNDEGESFDDLTAKCQNSEGTLSGMADTIRGSVSYHFEDLKSKVQNVGLQIGYSLLPAFDAVVQIIDTLAKVITPLISGLSKLANWITSLAVDAMQPWHDTLVDTINKIKEFASTSEKFQEFKDVVVGIFQNLKNDTKGIFDVIANLGGIVVNLLTLNFSGLRDNLKNIVSDIYTSIRDKVVAIGDVFDIVLEPIQTVWNDVWNAIRTVFMNCWNDIGNTLNTVVNGIIDAFGSVVSGVGEVIQSVANALDAINGTWLGDKIIWDGAIEGLHSAGDALTNFGNSAKTTWVDVKGITEDGANYIYHSCKDTIVGALQIVDDTLYKSQEAVEETEEVFVASLEGIGDAYEELTQTAEDNEIPDPEVPEIKGWKKFFNDLKKYWKSSTTELDKQVKKWDKIFESGLDKMYDALTVDLPNTLSTMAGYVNDIVSNIFDLQDTLLQNQIDALDKQLEKIEAYYDEILETAETTYAKQREEAEEAYKAELKALKQLYADGAISAEEYNAKKKALDDDYYSNKEASEQAYTEWSEQMAQEKADAEEAIAREQDELARQQFEANKNSQIATALINAAQAILMCYATGGWLLGTIYAVAVSIATGVEIANIKAQKYTSAFAEGGVIDKPTLALMGEQGKEAVVPLENNTEWMDALYNLFEERGGLGSQDYYNITINSGTTLNEVQLAKEMKKTVRDLAEAF